LLIVITLEAAGCQKFSQTPRSWSKNGGKSGIFMAYRLRGVVLRNFADGAHFLIIPLRL
jgi:hypothetical protein